MVVTLGQQYNVGEKPNVILYTYISHHAQLPVITQHIPTVVHSYEDSTNVDNSTIEPYKNGGLVNQKNVGVCCTISLIAMHGYRTNIPCTLNSLKLYRHKSGGNRSTVQQ